MIVDGFTWKVVTNQVIQQPLQFLNKVLQLNQVLIETGKQKAIDWYLHNDLHFI